VPLGRRAGMPHALEAGDVATQPLDERGLMRGR
jgi:hypothetical protein